MAQMIPSVLSPDVKSDAEKKIFRWFKEAPGTDEWVVLHSLGLAFHHKVIHGETDFLVLAPGLGIFALEVKGGRVARTASGKWTFTNRYGKTGYKDRGPFDQAWEGIHSIVKYVKENRSPSFAHLDYVLFGIGVMMPDIEFDTTGIDGKQWQVFDYRDVGTGHDVAGWIRRLSDGAREDWEGHFSSSAESKLPDRNDVRHLRDILRPEFDTVLPAGVAASKTVQQQIELTRDQFVCLDQLEDNKRLLITGGAGTGKTLLAVEAARRFTAAGEKVALFCYNNTLGEWLRKVTNQDKYKPSYAGTFHSWMTAYAPGPVSSEASDMAEWFERILPDRVAEKLDEKGPVFDRIIIDEAQDCISSAYLDVFDRMLNGGLDRGKWVMFGDFSMQAIYAAGQTEDKLIGLIDERASFARFRLKFNCRNTKQICDEIRIVTNAEVQSGKKQEINGPRPRWLKWDTQEEERSVLLNILEKLKKENVDPSQITVLSVLSFDNSVASGISGWKICPFRPGSEEECVTFSTVQAFKGMENRSSSI